MNRRRFRWWHGMTLGALLGVALWQFVSTFAGPGAPKLAVGMTASRFARLAPLAGTPGPREYRLADVTVHPPMDGKNLVTFHADGPGAPSPSPSIEMLAPIPFTVQPPALPRAPRQASAADLIARALGSPTVTPEPAPPPLPPVTYASVREFLEKAAPSLSVRYAWWEDERLRTAASLGGPFVLLGILLPFALQCLVWLGVLAPLPPPEPKPMPVVPEPPPTPKVDVDAMIFANAQLDELTGQMAEALAARPDDEALPVAPVTASFEPATGSARAAPLEPTTPAAAIDPTTFDAGVYYPVHRPKRGDI